MVDNAFISIFMHILFSCEKFTIQFVLKIFTNNIEKSHDLKIGKIVVHLNKKAAENEKI